MEELIEHLKEIGFNTYESKVYLSLLQLGRATGYEVSQHSGVPQARAYDTLKALASKKVVIATGEKPLSYMAVSPTEILNNYKAKCKQSIKYLKANLSNFSGDCVEPIVNIKDSKGIDEAILRIIDNAKKEILLEIWADDLKKYKKVLDNAKKRGVAIKVVGYDNVECDYDLVYQHSGAEYLEKAIAKCIILASDVNESIVVMSNKEKNLQDAIYTKNPALVFVAKELVFHDMFLIDIENTFGDDLTKIYGKNLIKLRDKLIGDLKLYMH